jgi:outer membrane protein assembly factor BamB
VYVFGAAGDLHAVSLDDGKERWSRSLYADYHGDEGYFGAGSTPILISGKLLVNVGGRGAGIVCLDAKTGQTLWKASDEAASYSSPAAAKVDGREQALFVTRLNCVLADPADGTIAKLFPFGKRGPTVNAASPLVLGDRLFVTASYGIGAELATLNRSEAKKMWANDESLSSQYSTPVEHNGFLYGNHGREDVGVAELRCVELSTGRVAWSKKDYGVAHLIVGGDKLLIQKVDGQLALATADPTSYRELASARVAPAPTRALPALSNGRLFIRSGSGGGELTCLTVGDGS